MFRLGGGKCIRRDQWQHKLKEKLKTGVCANTSRGAKGTTFREKKVVLGGWSSVQGLCTGLVGPRIEEQRDATAEVSVCFEQLHINPFAAFIDVVMAIVPQAG